MTLPTALPTLLAAPLSAGPAAEVTLLSPSEALDWNPDAVSLAFDEASDAALLAFSVAEECRSCPARRGAKKGCRRSNARVADIVRRDLRAVRVVLALNGRSMWVVVGDGRA